MYIIEITYKVPTEVIDAHMDEHMAYIDKYYGTGHFLASGRKEPRDGGLIFAKAATKARMEDIVAKDPFNKLGLADYRLIEFKATRKIKAYDAFAGENVDDVFL